MAKIYDAILAHASTQAESGDWVGVANILNTKNIASKHLTVWTVAKLIDKLGQDDATLVCQTIKTAAQTDPILDGAWIALNTDGLHLYQDDRQAMIDQLAVAGGWSDELKTAVKECGVTYSSPAESYGLPALTEADCESSWNIYLFEQEWSAIFNEQIVPNINDRANLIVALRAAADQLEA